MTHSKHAFGFCQLVLESPCKAFLKRQFDFRMIGMACLLFDRHFTKVFPNRSETASADNFR